MQENYVERLELAVVVNVPSWFSIAWRIACSIMDERTTARFRICSTVQVRFQRERNFRATTHRLMGTKNGV